MSELPKISELKTVILTVLTEMGGSAHFKDLERAVANHLQIDEPLLQRIRTGKRTEFSYRMSWARTACKNEGTINNLGKGIWRKN